MHIYSLSRFSAFSFSFFVSFGKESWEEGESELMKQASLLALRKAKIKTEDVRYVFAGDLLGQLIATTFGLMDFDIPLFGLYGACSTMGEAFKCWYITSAAAGAIHAPIFKESFTP